MYIITYLNEEKKSCQKKKLLAKNHQKWAFFDKVTPIKVERNTLNTCRNPIKVTFLDSEGNFRAEKSVT